ncbi:lipid II-degrading bacteriocin [Pseudomonas sivasensis]|uniref:lipid II-degrading bacteriocin n=1 Tax=Pseudomonas sivasensis TaxID=1880678 RepID=UPI0021AA69E8|nr:lipid II-degrading bacteriocin [Pseudomonas sivasensis]MCT4498790.1 lipid II-degrading bacteriocin [Pseudomonas sivasensis]
MELPNIVVTAPDPFYPGLNASGGGTMQSPAIAFNGMQLIRNGYYAQGMWREVLVRLCSEVAGTMSQYGRFDSWMIGESFNRDLKFLPFADNYMCITGVSPAAALDYAYLNPLLVTHAAPTQEVKQISASELGPVSALGHFINGEGATVRMDITKLGLNPSTTKIPMLEQHFNDMSIGTTRVFLDKVPYNTFDDSFNTGSVLGNITLKIEGNATKYENGSVVFNGEARAYNDKYDANQGSFRNALPEAATTVLRAIQNGTGAKEFEIEISGSLPIDIQR